MKERRLEGGSGLELVDLAWFPGRIVSREWSEKAFLETAVAWVFENLSSGADLPQGDFAFLW